MARGWDPIQDLVTLQERMHRLFDDTAQRRSREEAEGAREIEGADWFPAADVYEQEKEFVIAIDLPGIDRTALDIGLDENNLTIRGLRTVENEGQRRVERPYGRFMRRFGLPPTVDQKGITAEYKDGVLRLHLPKRKEQKARRVEIKVS